MVAAQLFSERGFDAASLQDIANAAGIRKASLYTHVASKEEFLRLIFEDYIDRMLSGAKAIYAADVSAQEKLRRLIGELFESIEHYRAHVVVFAEEKRYIESAPFNDIRQKRDGYRRIVMAILDEGMASGEFRKIDSKIITFLVIGMTEWAYHWYRTSGPLGINEMTDIAVDFITHGLVDHQASAGQTKAVVKRAPARSPRTASKKPAARVVSKGLS